MSTSLGRALRTVLTLACALAALAVVAGPAAASEPQPETGEPPELVVLGRDYDADDNEYLIDLAGQLSVELGIAGRGFEPFAAEFPFDLQRSFCNFPEFAGIYAVIGLLTPPWRPSEAAAPENRVAGLALWVNELGAATVAGRTGCTPGVLVPGQTRLNIVEEFFGEFLATTRLTFCREGGVHVLTGTAINANGRSVTYLIPSTTDVWHFYTHGALGTIQESNEEVVNLRFDGFPARSAACGL